MPDDVPPPDDLVALELERRQAYRELLTFSESTAAQRLREFPGPDQWFERQQWPAELGARLEKLRDAERDAALAVHRHPAIAEALAEHRYRQLREALQQAADLHHPTPPL